MSEFQKQVNRLTNWQRNQWARAGYPGLQKKEPAALERFVTMKRAKRIDMPWWPWKIESPHR